MFLTRIVAALRKFGRGARAGTLAGLHPPAHLRKVLERERARADRTGERLSVITFAAASREADRVTTAWLAKILAGRLRSTDDAGWLDDRQVCAVLPGTAPRGAWKVVEDVCLNFPAS